MKQAFIILLCVIAASCSSQRISTEQRNDTNTLQIITQQQQSIDSLMRVIRMFNDTKQSREQKDSSYHSVIKSDSTIVSDSTYVRERADGTTIIEHFHNSTTTRTLRDTVYDQRLLSIAQTRISILVDSINALHAQLDSIATTDSTTTIQFVTNTVEVEKKLSAWQKALMFAGMGFIVWLVTYLLLKFRILS